MNKITGLTASNLVATVPAIVVEIAFPVRRQTLCRNKLKKKKNQDIIAIVKVTHRFLLIRLPVRWRIEIESNCTKVDYNLPGH